MGRFIESPPQYSPTSRPPYVTTHLEYGGGGISHTGWNRFPGEHGDDYEEEEDIDDEESDEEDEESDVVIITEE